MKEIILTSDDVEKEVMSLEKLAQSKGIGFELGDKRAIIVNARYAALDTDERAIAVVFLPQSANHFTDIENAIKSMIGHDILAFDTLEESLAWGIGGNKE